MSGFTEVILIVALILGILLVPRMMNKEPEARIVKRPGKGLKLAGWMRLGILASFVWPGIVAVYLKPWSGHWQSFLYIAIGPVALAWGIFWVSSGFRKKGI